VAEVDVLFAIMGAEGRLFIQEYEDVHGDCNADRVDCERFVREEDDQSEENGEDSDVHGVADVSVEAADDEGLGRMSWREGSVAYTDEPDDGFEEWDEAESDEEGAERDSPDAAVGWDVPASDPCGDVKADDARASEEGEEDGDEEIIVLHGVLVLRRDWAGC
jgi:hypothetical protein